MGVIWQDGGLVCSLNALFMPVLSLLLKDQTGKPEGLRRDLGKSEGNPEASRLLLLMTVPCLKRISWGL